MADSPQPMISPPIAHSAEPAASEGPSPAALRAKLLRNPVVASAEGDSAKPRPLHAFGEHGRTGVTRYLQLYSVLAQALTDGAFAPGTPLPSEPELVRQFRVSRTTVRRALSQLEAEGRVVRRRGSGTFARDTRALETLELNLPSLLDPASPGLQLTTTLLRFGPGAPPPALLAQFPELSESTYIIQTVRQFQSRPLLVSSTFVPAGIACRISKRQLAHLSLAGVLGEAGVRAPIAEHSLQAIVANALAVRHLRVTLSAPLLCVRSVLRDASGEVCALDETLIRSDLCRVRTSHAPDSSRKRATSWRAQVA